VVNGGEPRLRGCIGSLEARGLINGFRDYALTRFVDALIIEGRFIRKAPSCSEINELVYDRNLGGIGFPSPTSSIMRCSVEYLRSLVLPP